MATYSMCFKNGSNLIKYASLLKLKFDQWLGKLKLKNDPSLKHKLFVELVTMDLCAQTASDTDILEE